MNRIRKNRLIKMACWIYITYLLTNGAKVICIWFFLTDICMNNVLCLAIYGTDWCFCCAHISFCVFWFAILWPNHSFIWAHRKWGSVIINVVWDIRINIHFCQYNIIGMNWYGLSIAVVRGCFNLPYLGKKL